MIDGTEWLAKPGLAGRVAPGTITVRDACGELCPPGEVGEIFFPRTFAERFQYIGAVQPVDSAGRLSLGDLGYVDETAICSWLTGVQTWSSVAVRISTWQVEAALDEQPDVAAAVVIGLPCEEFGHRAMRSLRCGPARRFRWRMFTPSSQDT